MSKILVPAGPAAGLSRRALVSGSGKAVLSATAVALLMGCESMAKSTKTQTAAASMTENDVAILNVALGLEHEAIAAYQIGAESGLLQKPTLDVAVLFQSQHKAHRDALVSTIGKLGGTAVAEMSMDEYAKALNVAAVKNEADVLRLAAKLEKGAANAYLGVIPSFENRDLAQVSGRLAADETMHWTVLASALREPLPQGALSFGA